MEKSNCQDLLKFRGTDWFLDPNSDFSVWKLKREIDRDFLISIVETRFLKECRNSQLSKLALKTCWDRYYRSRPWWDKSKPPGLIKCGHVAWFLALMFILGSETYLIKCFHLAWFLPFNEQGLKSVQVWTTDFFFPLVTLIQSFKVCNLIL
jgi:hypothetical protein